jgi:UDP-N-acetyl-D-mannosaminuronic acid dehydrogenase
MLPSDFNDSRVCVLGLGYVGLTLAVAMADVGFAVHGLEVRQDVLDGLARDEPHFWEPRLADKLARVRASGRFTFSLGLDANLKASTYIITVGTPLDEHGKAKLGAVQHAAREIAEHMQDGALIILRSTVKLGTARKVIAPILEESGKRFQIAVCPERTLEGRALVELTELPQIVGADTPDTRARCAQLFGMLTPTAVRLNSLEAAELAKLADNTYRDVTFGFANEIARLCAEIGVSAADVIRAGRYGYPRTNIAWPGPVGGPCLEKDPHILAESAAEFGIDMRVTKAARWTNEVQPAEIAANLVRQAGRSPGFAAKPRIRVLGLAFKGVPATDDLRGTMAKPIVDALRHRFPDADLAGYDPVVSSQAAQDHFGFGTDPTLQQAFEGSSIVIIANNHPAFQTMELGALAQSMRSPAIVFDCWNMHNAFAESLPEGVSYLGLGDETAVGSRA